MCQENERKALLEQIINCHHRLPTARDPNPGDLHHSSKWLRSLDRLWKPGTLRHWIMHSQDFRVIPGDHGQEWTFTYAAAAPIRQGSNIHGPGYPHVMPPAPVQVPAIGGFPPLSLHQDCSSIWTLGSPGTLHYSSGSDTGGSSASGSLAMPCLPLVDADIAEDDDPKAAKVEYFNQVANDDPTNEDSHDEVVEYKVVGHQRLDDEYFEVVDDDPGTQLEQQLEAAGLPCPLAASHTDSIEGYASSIATDESCCLVPMWRECGEADIPTAGQGSAEDPPDTSSQISSARSDAWADETHPLSTLSSFSFPSTCPSPMSPTEVAPLRGFPIAKCPPGPARRPSRRRLLPSHQPAFPSACHSAPAIGGSMGQATQA